MMIKPPIRAVLCTLIAAASIGCSDSGPVAAIDQKAATEKAAGGEGTARQSPKAKAASAEAELKHPKLK